MLIKFFNYFLSYPRALIYVMMQSDSQYKPASWHSCLHTSLRTVIVWVVYLSAVIFITSIFGGDKVPDAVPYGSDFRTPSRTAQLAQATCFNSGLFWFHLNSGNEGQLMRSEAQKASMLCLFSTTICYFKTFKFWSTELSTYMIKTVTNRENLKEEVIGFFLCY